MFKRLFCWAYFRGSLFSEGLIIGGSFAFQIGLDLTIKTASTNSPWAYIREGLLLEEYLRLSFGGLRCFCIFGRASLFLFVFFWGGAAVWGGGNFTVFYALELCDFIMRVPRTSRVCYVRTLVCCHRWQVMDWREGREGEKESKGNKTVNSLLWACQNICLKMKSWFPCCKPTQWLIQGEG